MKKTEKTMYLNLQLFGEGAGASGIGTGTGDGGTGTPGTKGETATAAVSRQGVKGKNNLSDVKYGIQTDAEPEAQAPDVQTKEPTEPTPDRQTTFENMIKGEFKDLYDAKVQNIVKERLKASKETESKLEALTPILELLGQKHGVDSTDIDALKKAVEEDDSYWEDEAMKKGMSVETLKEIRKIQRENAVLNREKAEQQAREKASADVARWIEQSKDAKAVHPNFDLRTEMKNPQFMSLLKSNIDPKTAYEVIHHDELMRGAMQFTAKTVEEKVVNNIMANGTRPVENGNASQGASMTKSDVSQLTKADREEIARRVARGEKISFG